jgi:multidrug efflux pump subunit AcrA (membrane-fusion protein)
MKRKKYLPHDFHPSLEDLQVAVGAGELTSLSLVKSSRFNRYATLILVIFFIFSFICLLLLPWRQTSFGFGQVVPYLPNERLQEINSPVKGLISKWHVVEGMKIKKDDPIADISDIDPNLMERLQSQYEAAKVALNATDNALETSEMNLKRQKLLADKGLKSQRDYELASLEYNKFRSEVSTKRKELADIEVKLARQSSQVVRAPRDGVIMRIFFPQGGAFVKDGDKIATLAPDTDNKTVELMIDGNDLPLVHEGHKVRLQFEGWPAIQFSGWPSKAIGTFGGLVTIIDPSDNGKGQFRVLVFPDPEDQHQWPFNFYLRQGVRVKGWILLEEVSLGYELWRKFNGFPPVITKRKQDKGFFNSISKGIKKIVK